jgi:hypothetical protein
VVSRCECVCHPTEHLIEVQWFVEEVLHAKALGFPPSINEHMRGKNNDRCDGGNVFHVSAQFYPVQGSVAKLVVTICYPQYIVDLLRWEKLP